MRTTITTRPTATTATTAPGGLPPIDLAPELVPANLEIWHRDWRQRSHRNWCQIGRISHRNWCQLPIPRWHRNWCTYLDHLPTGAVGLGVYSGGGG